MTTNEKTVVAALYRFTAFTDFEAWREKIRQTMLDNDVKGEACPHCHDKISLA